MRQINTLVLASIIIYIFLGGNTGFADDVLANLHEYRGEVKVTSGDNEKEVVLKMELFNNDVVLTKNGEAEVLFLDGSIVKLRPNTELRIVDSPENKERDVKLSFGRLWFRIQEGSKPTKFSGPTSVAAIRGTEGEIFISKINRIARYGCASGQFCVYATVNGETFFVCLKKGFFTIVYPNSKPLDPMRYIIGQIAGTEDIYFDNFLFIPEVGDQTGGNRGSEPASGSGRQ
ncbi:MAG: hypothetical protein A2161_07325 [Candidatus Schekmanbacteria bacterium RBG_13_48_7]|uniref:FecR protein domain-containing protein n=1 Tax=Candidatus Schekmanbacteria bacterium RBG_13_48_7 TaxID=1817878 RepID=A0A1F7S1G4_9BACT|nr:MAG: hypothetical protein A2161_07325 [Candidatus Schekmanbacteria bacterium RBG_13_48_7]